jgi:hypothetical protein
MCRVPIASGRRRAAASWALYRLSAPIFGLTLLLPGMATATQKASSNKSGTEAGAVIECRPDPQLLGLGRIALQAEQNGDNLPSDPGEKAEKRSAKKKAEQAEADDEQSASSSKKARAQKAEGNRSQKTDIMSWLPFAVFGVVAAPIFILLWLSFGRKSKGAREVQEAERARQYDPELERQRALRTEYESIMGSSSGGFANASVTMGGVGLIAWCLPIVGLPLTITGLVMGIRALNSHHSGKATVGIVLCLIGLVLSLGNAALGVQMAMKGKYPLLK